MRMKNQKMMKMSNSLETDLNSLLAVLEDVFDHEPADEICQLISINEEAVNQIIKEIEDKDRCARCGYKLVNPDDFTYATEYETDPSPAHYDYNTGYICPYCNHQERF
jgi:hypothetical protein